EALFSPCSNIASRKLSPRSLMKQSVLGALAICILILGAFALAQMPSPTNPARIVIAASTLFDGKGHVLHDTRIVIEGARIVAVDPKAAPVDYDLRGLTVLPGWIDSHVHISWSFGPDGKNVNGGGTTQEAA